ncbi:VF530 family DNA-binding protein [Psychrobium sp. 1_MG-2023]|uniref:VF530 family protein n=1 Tax=Psychrobium sp. 1_MG-2023 TaxID=3062624 RepID=UPI000C325B98|nr:VF530 family protein [Psychrobium sp. 1_MG-2023]MDP2562714.1 VF530 family protein [Psychrobium sp. 1_MG-2023]PKF54023.1 DUF2132 domain-containing protein [Alteromonadales bacterium alter-6D02]
MSQKQPNNPLHGLTLENIVTALVERHGFPHLSRKIEIRCFYNDPSIKSSLKFLRKTPWAREQVEQYYLETCLNQESEQPEKFVWPELKKK